MIRVSARSHFAVRFALTFVFAIVTAVLPSLSQGQGFGPARDEYNYPPQGPMPSTTEPAANSNPTTQASGSPAPKSETNDDEDDCKDSVKTAEKTCTTPDMTAGLSQQQQQQAQQLQGQANQANQNTQQAGASQAAQCKNQADLSKILAALSGLKGGACVAMVGKCKSSCGDRETQATNEANAITGTSAEEQNKKRLLLSRAKAAKKRGEQCGDYAPNGAMALAQAGAMLAGMFMNQKCAEQSSLTGSPSPSPSPGAANDCTNPEYAKTSILCICQNDPKNRMCSKGEQFPGGLQTTNGDFGPSTPGYGDGDENISDGTPVGGFSGKPNTAAGSSTTEGGGGGGPQAGAGGGGGNGAGADDGSGRSNVDKNVITGQSGGSGAAGGMGGGAGGGNSGRSGGGGRGEGGDRFDLSKYLPKSKTRGLAGMSITAKDGITGPMGPSIFEKVSSQYQIQKVNMIQDK